MEEAYQGKNCCVTVSYVSYLSRFIIGADKKLRYWLSRDWLGSEKFAWFHGRPWEHQVAAVGTVLSAAGGVLGSATVHVLSGAWGQILNGHPTLLLYASAVIVLVIQSRPTLWDPVDCGPQVSLSMEFSRQEQWSGVPFPSPGDLPDPGIEPGFPALKVDSLPSEPPGKAWIVIQFSSIQLSSVAQSCLTLCDPMDCSTPGLPVHHQLLEFTQTHLHWVGDAIQPSQLHFNFNLSSKVATVSYPKMCIFWLLGFKNLELKIQN